MDSSTSCDSLRSNSFYGDLYENMEKYVDVMYGDTMRTEVERFKHELDQSFKDFRITTPLDSRSGASTFLENRVSKFVRFVAYFILLIAMVIPWIHNRYKTQRPDEKVIRSIREPMFILDILRIIYITAVCYALVFGCLFAIFVVDSVFLVVIFSLLFILSLFTGCHALPVAVVDNKGLWHSFWTSIRMIGSHWFTLLCLHTLMLLVWMILWISAAVIAEYWGRPAGLLGHYLLVGLVYPFFYVVVLLECYYKAFSINESAT